MWASSPPWCPVLQLRVGRSVALGLGLAYLGPRTRLGRSWRRLRPLSCCSGGLSSLDGDSVGRLAKDVYYLCLHRTWLIPPPRRRWGPELEESGSLGRQAALPQGSTPIKRSGKQEINVYRVTPLILVVRSSNWHYSDRYTASSRGAVGRTPASVSGT